MRLGHAFPTCSHAMPVFWDLKICKMGLGRHFSLFPVCSPPRIEIEDLQEKIAARLMASGDLFQNRILGSCGVFPFPSDQVIWGWIWIRFSIFQLYQGLIRLRTHLLFYCCLGFLGCFNLNQGTGNEWKCTECKGHCNKQQLRMKSSTSLFIYYPFIGHLFEFLACVGCPLAQLRLDLNAFAINGFTRKHLVVACCCGSWWIFQLE